MVNKISIFFPPIFILNFFLLNFSPLLLIILFFRLSKSTPPIRLHFQIFIDCHQFTLYCQIFTGCYLTASYLAINIFTLHMLSHLSAPWHPGNLCGSPLNPLYSEKFCSKKKKKISWKGPKSYVFLPRWGCGYAFLCLKRLLHFGQARGGTGSGEELPQLRAHSPAPFASPVPGHGQRQWQTTCLLLCQTLCSPPIPKWISRRLQEALAWWFSREAQC